jgi:hypothetical protein
VKLKRKKATMKLALLRLFLFIASIPVFLLAWVMVCVGERRDFSHARKSEASEKETVSMQLVEPLPQWNEQSG